MDEGQLFSLQRLQTLREQSKKIQEESNFSKRSAYDREDIAEIPDEMMEAIPSTVFENSPTTPLTIPTRIFGPESLQTRIRAELETHKEVFSKTVKEEAATVEPFELLVDPKEWEQPANRQGTRKMDNQKSYELRKQINLLLEKGVIEPSTQGYYSHGFVVPTVNLTRSGEWLSILKISIR